MIIRTAQIADAERIAGVHVDALSYERRAQNWKRPVAERHQCLFVAEDADRIARFVNAGPGREAPGGFDSEICAIYLLRAHQARGTGAALFRATVQWRVAHQHAVKFELIMN